MGRKRRSVRLQTKDARRALPVAHAPYWFEVRPLLHIGFRKGRRSSTWLLRENIGGKQYKRRVGNADDENVDADHVTVLSFEDVLKVATAADRPTAGLLPRYTVNAALDAYWNYRRAKSSKSAVEGDKVKIKAHVADQFGETDLADLTTETLKAWRDSLVKDTDDLDLKRRSKASANRIRAVFFAALNLAYEHGRVQSRDPWQRVKPFKNVDEARKRSLTVGEAIKVINACDPDFRSLVRGSLYTGLRLGELIALRAADVSADRIEVRHSKSAKPRSVPLNDEGSRFFEEATAGKKGADLVFIRSDGHPWQRIHASRGMKRACTRAGIDPPATFHDLRRSYASILINKKTDVEVIQRLLGHADLRMTVRAYAHLLDATISKAVKNKLPSFGLAPTRVKTLRR
jgi:integrase